MNSDTSAEKAAKLPVGAVGLALSCLFLAGSVAAPGSFFSVMLGGVAGLAGAVASILGIATNSGRLAGVLGLVLFVLAWALNTLVIPDR